MFSIICCHAQNMQEGFDLLESQSYTEAESYFAKLLSSHPTNKTAKICHARALGLGGKPVDALQIFKTLSEEYPGDQEVNLNLAEAFMWSKESSKAADLYKNILQNDLNNFTANLGMANALSAQLKNVEALNYINKAISLDPNNQSAKISKKYIFLALADRERNNFNFKNTLRLLDSVLILFPYDREAVLNKAISHLWMNNPIKASKEYKILLEKEIEIFEALLGLSYCSTLTSKKGKAIEYADQAILYARENELAEDLQKRALINKINCIGIKGDYKEAYQSLEEFNGEFSDDRMFQIANARFLVWEGKPKKGLVLLQKLNEDYPDNFEILMGMADAWRALKNNTKAIEFIDKALLIQETQPDALRLREELKSESNPSFTASGFRSKDVAKNNNTGLTARLEFGSIDKLRSYVDLKLNTLSNEEPLQKAAQYILTYGSYYRLNSKIRLNAHIQPTLATDNNAFKSTNLLFNIGGEYQVNQRNSLAYNFEQEAHNFNVDLLKSGIIMNNHKFTYSLNTKFDLGLFAQYIYTTQSDRNKKRLFFASLYNNVLKSPLVQTGLNYTNIGFSEQRPNLYFSPERYNAFEGFVKVNNFDSRRAKVLYHFMAAVGLQNIDNTTKSNSLRIEADLGYRVAKRVRLLAYYRYSSSASSTAVGFNWSALGVRTSIVF